MLNPDLLYRHPIFSVVERDKLSAWAESAQLHRMATGEILCREHETQQSLFVIQSGRVRVLRKAEDNREITVGTCKPGELIGDYSLLEPHRSAATCRVSSDAEIWSLPLAPALRILRNQFGDGVLRPWLKLQFLCRFLRNECYLGFMSAGSFLPLLHDCQQYTFEAGETIQVEGLFSDSVFVVVDGSVQIENGNVGTTEIVREANHIFGVETLVRDTSIPCVSALTRAICWRFNWAGLFHTRRPGSASQPESAGQSLTNARSTLSLHFPFIRQQSATECGCAALAMVAKYYRLPVTLDSIRQILTLQNRGANLAAMIQAAERIGLKARAARITDQHLSGAKLPAIAHLHGDHYVVIYEMNAQDVVIGDPAIGVIRHSRRQLRELWDGTLLLLQPSEIHGSPSAILR